ncbi:MAG: DNA repair protein RecO [Candidatus Omnitrophica bacterium]|nr:DNA repair protein RecO [Candidatus Omnitrophota bacterium]
MVVHYRTRGFFIKKTDRGEDSRLFTVYTKNFGKLKILGKAIRKIGSKLKSGAELLCLSEVEFIQGKTHKTLTDAILIDNFPVSRKDLKKLSVARQIIGTLDTLISKEERDDKIWELLNETFNRLNLLEIRNSTFKILYHYFFWNFVSILGYKPEFHDCNINKTTLDCDIVKIIKVILRKDWQILSRLKIEPRHQKLLKIVSEWYTKKIII